MAKQTINIGTIANDGTGSTLRAAGDLINDNFNEIYSSIGDGTTLSASFVTLTGTQTLTNKTLTSPTITGTGAIAGTFTGNITGDVTGDVTGNVTGNVTGDVTGNVTGDLTGNADTATALTTARTIAGQSFDGTGNITIAATDLSDTDQALATSSNVQFGNLTLSGNLTVNGSTTTVNSTNTTLDDNLLELNSGATSNANDTGIIMERGSTGDNAIIAWDESADKFVVGTTTATASDTGDLSITTGTLVANIEGNITGDVTGNADTATTLATGRTIGMTGDVVWTSASFDGSGNVTGVAALQANTVSSTELVSAVQLQILDSSGSVVKSLYGSGS